MKLLTILYLGIIALVMIVAIKTVSPVSVISIPASNDSYIANAATGTNYGDDASYTVILTNSRSTSIKNMILQYPLTSIPAGVTIIRVEAWMQVYDEYMGAGEWVQVSVHKVGYPPEYNWTELSVTWDNGPRNGTAINSTILNYINVTDGISGNKYWNVTWAVNRSYVEGDAFITLYFNSTKGVVSATGDNTRWMADGSGWTPYINITYSGEPPAGVSCACAYGIDCHLSFTGDCHNTSTMDLGGADLYLECNGGFYIENSGQLLNIGNIYPQDTCDWYVQAGVNITIM